MELDPGTVVAKRYRISHPLGRGGMGEVFAAENVRTGRPVAVKLLRADSKTKSSAVARFQREARAAGSIHSDYVTQVLDVDEDPEHGIVLVFELLEGESLIDRLKRTGPMPFEELWGVAEQVWIGLADAHKVGIIHRDLKPSNVFLERRPDGQMRVKLLDFGISKLPKAMGGETITEMGQSLGTFSFMPPEQIGKAKTVDHRADIYAGTTLIYQSLSGQLPYQAKNILVMVEMKSKTDPRPLAEAMGCPIDPRLEAFISKGLARDPAKRFQTALEALAAWRELAPGRPTPLPPSGSMGGPFAGATPSAPVYVPPIAGHVTPSGIASLRTAIGLQDPTTPDTTATVHRLRTAPFAETSAPPTIPTPMPHSAAPVSPPHSPPPITPAPASPISPGAPVSTAPPPPDPSPAHHAAHAHEAPSGGPPPSDGSSPISSQPPSSGASPSGPPPRGGQVRTLVMGEYRPAPAHAPVHGPPAPAAQSHASQPPGLPGSPQPALQPGPMSPSPLGTMQPAPIQPAHAAHHPHVPQRPLSPQPPSFFAPSHGAPTMPFPAATPAPPGVGRDSGPLRLHDDPSMKAAMALGAPLRPSRPSVPGPPPRRPVKRSALPLVLGAIGFALIGFGVVALTLQYLQTGSFLGR